MRPLFWALCSGTGMICLTAQPPPKPEATLVFSGDIRGYLSPCGCTKPQIGGIKRLAGVVRALLKQPDTYYADLGNWTEAKGRQDELKAEALATAFGDLKPAYLNVGQSEARMGVSYLESLSEMTGGRLDSSNGPFEDALAGIPGRVAGRCGFRAC